MKGIRKITGIDEAGRGPVIGPMVVAGVLVREEDIPRLVKTGVKDSKRLTPRRRDALAREILGVVEAQCVKVIGAEEIDASRREKSLNVIEAEMMAEVIKSLLPDEVQLGSVDVIEERFGIEISRLVGGKPSIVSVHHAEDRYPAVAAASIIAKTTRDKLVSDLRKKYGDFGSGYPSDPKTLAFITRAISEGEIPPIVRRSWKTFLDRMVLNSPDP